MTYPWEIDLKSEPHRMGEVYGTGIPSVRPELTKDVNGLYPGEAERGFPDFLRRAIPEASPQETAPCWVPPSEATN